MLRWRGGGRGGVDCLDNNFSFLSLLDLPLFIFLSVNMVHITHKDTWRSMRLFYDCSLHATRTRPLYLDIVVGVTGV